MVDHIHVQCNENLDLTHGLLCRQIWDTVLDRHPLFCGVCPPTGGVARSRRDLDSIAVTCALCLLRELRPSFLSLVGLNDFCMLGGLDVLEEF